MSEKVAVTASMVKELRERTGGGLLECKKALEEANGNVDQAVDVMRKAGTAKAAKKAGRVAAEGIIVMKIAADAKSAFMLELNCETDFVSRGDGFRDFANAVTERGLTEKVTGVLELSNIPFVVGQVKTIGQAREELIGKIGENINIRRAVFMSAEGVISSYLHGGRIGVLVNLSIPVADLGKDIAMHIAASKPQVILPEDLRPDVLDKEREIYLAQVQASGKPQQIMDKMVEGKLSKFIDEVTLVRQPFIKNPEVTVGDLLQKAGAKVVAFQRFEVGEGIEKEVSDFAAEVMATVKEK